MTEQARIMEHGKVEVKYRKEAYEKLWILPDWETVQLDENSLTAQNFHFETGKSSRVKAKWETGIYLNRSRNTFGVYCKLVDVTGFQDKKLKTIINTSFLQPNSRSRVGQTQELTFEVNQIHEFPNWLSYGCRNSASNSYVNSNGELSIQLNMTLLEPETPSSEMKLEEFRKSSIGIVRANLATLLNDKSTADAKIVTSGGNELFAHKAVLQAQCPVFESMFRSKMSENQTGIVDIQDITGKTMSILLRYFYFGELLPSWKDEDTVVEFTYAAGKYQLTDILELLDSVLGSWSKEDATQTDVLLIDVAAKLGLKNAEKQLLQRIAEKTNKVKSREELFGLFGLGN